MLKNYIFLVFACSIVSCKFPERNCEDFKTGTFRFDYAINGEQRQGTFIRTPVFSVDYYENKIDSASIRWINACEFILQPLDGEAAIHYKILTTTNNSYTFEYQRAVKDPNRQLVVKKGTAIKIN